MELPTLYLSRPSVYLPGRRVTNEELLEVLRGRFTGDAGTWSLIEAGVSAVFARCGSAERYIEDDPAVRVGDVAARAGARCLEANGVAPTAVDLVINGGVAREYFEPSTAMEVAAKVGVERAHAFDVTSACVGQLESVHVAAGLLALHPEMRHALLVSGELTRGFLSREIQGLEDLRTRAAGLTIGNAAAAWLLGREPFPGGSLRIRAMGTVSLPVHWGLCQAPIDGTFASLSTELFKLNVHVPGIIGELLSSIDLEPADVHHFVFHQPSDLMVDKVLGDLGVEADRGLKVHGRYGNTVSTSVALCMDALVASGGLAEGDLLVLSSAAAGFTVATLVGVWESAPPPPTH